MAPRQAAEAGSALPAARTAAAAASTTHAADSEPSRIELLEYHRGHVAGSVVLLGDGDSPTGARQERSGAGAGASAAAGARGAQRGWGVLSVLRAAFLPEGFPESVSPDYLSE